MKQNCKPVGIALGAGGVKGIAHLGALRCLLDNGIPVDLIAGSSMGALIGAMYAYAEDLAEVEGLFASLYNLRQGSRLIDFATRGGVIRGNKIETFLDTYLQRADFSQLRLPLEVVATDLNTGGCILLNSGLVAKAVRASISAAPVIQPVEYGGRTLSDGALSNPVPADVVRAMGAEYVIAVSLTNGYFEQQIDATSTLANIGKRGLAVTQYNLARHTVRAADVVLEPAIDNQSILGLEALLDPHSMPRIIQAGFDAAQVHIATIRLALGLD